MHSADTSHLLPVGNQRREQSTRWQVLAQAASPHRTFTGKAGVPSL